MKLLSRKAYDTLVFFFTLFMFVSCKILRLFIPKRKFNNCLTIVITGTFYSHNWLLSHLIPISQSSYCHKLYMVAADRVPAVNKVIAVYPPEWMKRIFGKSLSRLLMFIWICLRIKPEIIGGFHLLINGMLACFLSGVTGARSLYICGGGIREVKDGGYDTENKIYNKLSKPYLSIEKMLLSIIATTDITITMGSNPIQYFKKIKSFGSYHVVPGGFNAQRFFPSSKEPDNDLILVGRLSEIKSVDIFLETIKLVSSKKPNLRAIIVGDGPLKSTLEGQAKRYNISQLIDFVGMRSNVEDYYRRSKIFVLTSRSEGLSLAMIEAMLCGLPVVVPNVGDLGDMVEHGKNGFLLDERTPEAFSQAILNLLDDKNLLLKFRIQAINRARQLLIPEIITCWNSIFAKVAVS